jgi:hypothetical protein
VAGAAAVALCASSGGCIEDIEYSVPGNMFYGYIGMASGITHEWLKWGAGRAERHDPAHDPESDEYTGPYAGIEDYTSPDPLE